jgi:hypothetical protein
MEFERRQPPLPEMCSVLDVRVSGFRAWMRGGAPGLTRLSEVQAVVVIKTIHAEVFAALTARGICIVSCRSQGHPVGPSRIERLMRDNDVRARHKRRYKAATDSKPVLSVEPNRLNRQFSSASPGRVWTGGITYIDQRRPAVPGAVEFDWARFRESLAPRGDSSCVPESSRQGAELRSNDGSTPYGIRLGRVRNVRTSATARRCGKILSVCLLSPAENRSSCST